MRYLGFLGSIFLVCSAGMSYGVEMSVPVAVRHRSSMAIRDPFIVPWQANKTYYLYASCSYKGEDGKNKRCFGYYKSKDLNMWEGPFPAFVPGKDFWATKDFWAPEVHEYKGKFYLFATMNSETRKRGTQIMRADTPEGPFEPISEFPQTPAEWLCLDGTLWVEEGKPWMVYCHEWLDVQDGTIEAIPLSDDLSKAIGPSTTLFKGSSAPWGNGPGRKTYVTDGPFLFKRDGELLMLWSSFGPSGYTTGLAKSTTGKVLGPWTQLEDPIFCVDGGHSSRFKTFDGRQMTVLHAPNSGATRMVFLEGEDWIYRPVIDGLAK